MAGTRHRLFSAAVAAQGGVPVWRAIGEAKLWMRPLSDAFIAAYVAREWDSIRWTVGCYEIEGAGVTLFDRVEGEPWNIIGMPMLPLLAWLRATGPAQSLAPTCPPPPPPPHFTAPRPPIHPPPRTMTSF